jgi:hypothetical protein
MYLSFVSGFVEPSQAFISSATAGVDAKAMTPVSKPIKEILNQLG